MSYCILTGVELTDNTSSPIKKMCLNCKSCIHNDDDTYSCNNKDVMEYGKKKILEAVPDGFEIANLELKPMLLKKPTNKCGHYTSNSILIKQVIYDYFSSDEKKETTEK